MFYEGFSKGFYLIKQKSQSKGKIDHYGILDVGNTMGFPEVDSRHPIVIHQTPPKITVNRLDQTGNWKVMGKITDERDAKKRIYIASRNPVYNLFSNNCEHFARYIAYKKSESMQIQTTFILLGLVVLVGLFLKSRIET
jgi:hypothetical protein